jgi:hypothetical protein
MGTDREGTLKRQAAAHMAESAAAGKQAEAATERAAALREIGEAVHDEAGLANDGLERTLLGRESEQAYREAKTMDSEVRRLLAERDRAKTEANTKQVKLATLLKKRA